MVASEANEPGSESGKRSDDRRGVPEGTPQEGGASTPLAAPGSFAAAAMITRTAAPGDSDAMLRTQNLHVVKTEPLVSPRAIKRELPGSDALYEVVVRARATIRDIIAGRDRRLLAVVGPCSIHDPEAA